jgi:hypothetical protein
MRTPHFPDNAPLDASITEGYEVIGTDGEGSLESPAVPYDRPASEMGDDVQSLADTDTGTDAFTNDVDTSSSEDEMDEDDLDDENGEPGVASDHTLGVSGSRAAHHESHEVDMTMAEQSLEHPTELSIPGSARMSRQSSASALDHADPILERASSAAGLARERAAAKASKSSRSPVSDIRGAPSKANDTSDMHPIWHMYEEATARLRQDAGLQEYLKRFLIIILSVAVSCGYMQYTQRYSAGSPSGELSTVPVASVSSMSTASITEIVLSTSTVTSTITSTKIQSNALQTTSSSKNVASIPSGFGSGLSITPNVCSADVHGRNEILLRVPQQIKDSWLAKQAVMISVSRGSTDLPFEFTRVSSVEQGFLIQVPLEEAHGTLDVSIATTRKPKISETFRVNFGRFMLTEALDVGVQLMKGFAQTVVDTVNGTTAWVEETCVPALDRMSKQSSVTDSITQSFHDISQAALSLSGQVVDQVKETITPDRVFQAETEILRTAQDVRDELSLGLLRGQLGSKLWWLKIRGRTSEYERYLAAAEPYYRKKVEQAADASRARAAKAKKEILARRRKERREARRPFWATGEGEA